MATISNIIQTIFQSSGANNTNRDIDNINRNMTRLGQASASAGRSFAAQSQGLGGLVAAYAGAAATTFALQQAFDKLAQSARQSQTLEGLNTLAARSGESSTLLLENVRELTKNQLTLAEAASQINLSLSAGFDSSQIEGLSEVALKASRALGRDLNDAYTRVVRGSAKMETELLDELGIYTKIDPATRAYAAAIGKTVGQLTEFERRQAFVNSVIEEGNRKFSSINTTLPTSAEQIEAFGTRILDIGGLLGRFLADQVAPLAEFLTNNLTASFAAFGAVASLVAAKGISVLTVALQTFTAETYKASLATQSNIRNYLGIGGATDRAGAALKNYSRDLTGVTTKEKDTFKALQQATENRRLSNAEMRTATKILTKNKSVVEAETRAQNDNRRSLLESNKAQRTAIKTTEQAAVAARQNLQTLQAQGASVSRVTAARVALTQAESRATSARLAGNAIIASNRAEMDRLRDSMLGTRSAANALTITMNSLSAAMGLRGATAGLGGGIFGAARLGIANIAAGFTGLVSRALGLFSIVSIFTLIGSSIADALGKGQEFDFFMRKLAQTAKSFFDSGNSKNMDNVLQGITAGALSELENTDRQLKELEDFTFDTKFITVDIELTKTKEDLVREVNSELKGALSGEQGKAGLTSTGSVMGSIIGGALGATLLTIIPGIGPVLGMSIGAAVGSYIGRALQDYFSKELTIDSFKDVGGRAYIENLKSEFSEAFEAVGGDLELALAKAFLNLEKDYAGALLDPIARKALEVQRKLLAESAKFSNNIESIAQLSAATGLTADRIKNMFDLTGSVDSFNEYASAVVEFAGEKRLIQFGFIDTFDKDLKAFLDKPILVEVGLASSINVDIFARIQDDIATALKKATSIDDAARIIEEMNYGSGGLESVLRRVLPRSADISSIIEEINSIFVEAAKNNAEITLEDILPQIKSVKLLFLEANDAVNTFSSDVARGTSNIIDLQNSIASGDIDLERFDQRISAISNSVRSSVASYVEAEAKIAALRAKLATIDTRTETGQADATQLTNLITSLETNLNYARDGVILGQETLEIFREQREELEKQASVREFLNSLIKGAKELDVSKTQMDLAAALVPDDSKLGARLDYLNQFTLATEKQIDIFDRLNYVTKQAGLSEAARQAILSASAANVDELVQELNRIPSTQAKVFAGTTDLIEVLQTDITENGVETKRAILDLADANGELVLSTRDAIEAQRALIMEAVAELPKVIETTKNEIISLINKLTEETNKINEIEIPRLRIEAELDRSKFDFEMNKLRTEDAITKLELQLDISALKAELGDITPDQDIENQKRIQQDILDKREELLNLELKANMEEASRQLELLEKEYTQNLDVIENNRKAQEEKIKGDIGSILNTIQAYEEIYNTGKQVNQSNLQDTLNVYRSVADLLLKNIVKGANEFSKVAVAALTKGEITVGDSSIIDVATPTFNTDKVDFTGVTESLKVYETAAIEAINNRAAAEKEAETISYENKKANIVNEAILEGTRYNQAIENLNTQRQIEDLNHRKRIKDLEEERSKGSDKAAKERERKLKEAQKELDKFYNDVEKGLKTLQKMAVDFISVIFDALVKSKQLEVEAAKVSESLATSILSNTTARLNSVQSDLNEALSKETSLKEELVGLNERLNESQTSYLRAIAEGDLATASEDYIDSILEQSRKTVELNRAMRDRAILEGAAQTLEQQQITVQEQVKIATQERIEAERELAEVQATTSGILELLSTDIFNFNDKLKDLAPALAAITGQVDDAFKNTGKPIEALAKNIDEVVKSVKEASKIVAGSTKTASKVTATAANEASSAVVEGVEAAGAQVGSTFAATAVSALSSALQGAGIGQTIGQILGDETSASTIGGALGAAVGSIIPGVGTVIGAIAGSLIGSLFGGPVKPAAYIRGNVTSEGYETYDIDRRDGLSKAAANSVESLVSQVYDSIFTSLERVNVKFKDDVDVFVRVTEGEFGRIRTTFKSGAVLTAKDLGSDPEVAAQELINEFLAGLTIERDENNIVTFRSLVVDALTPNASDVQQALDIFAELKDANKKTQEQFDKVVSFASGFRDSLAELNNAIPTLENSIALITSAAEAGAQNAIQANREYIETAEETFGIGSPQVEEARKALLANSLAQLGVMRAADGSLMSLKEYESGITAAGLAVNKIIEDFTAFGKVLIDSGMAAEDAGKAISFAIGTALADSIEDIAEIIDERLAIARDPSFGAVKDVLNIYKSNQDLLEELKGQSDALLKASDPNTLLVPIEAFEENLNNVIEEAFSNPVIKDFIESLSEPIEASALTDVLSDVTSAEKDYYDSVTKAAQAVERAERYVDPDEGQNLGPQIRRAAEEAIEQAFDSKSIAEAAREAAIAQIPTLQNFFDSLVGTADSVSFYSDYFNRDIELSLDSLPPELANILDPSSLNSLVGSYSAVTDAQKAYNDQVAFNEQIVNAAGENLKKYNDTQEISTNAEELARLEFQNGLKNLTAAQIKAVLASEDLTDSTYRQIAAERLVVQQQIEAFDTIKKVSSSFKDFNSRLEDLTGIISAPMLNEGFASLSEVMTILGETDLTGFSAGLTSAVNGISSSNNVFTSYTGSINKLNDAMATGNLGTQEYIDLLILFSDAAISAAESQKEVIEAYQSAADDLRQLFNSTLSSVQDAISGMRDQLVGLVDAISESSNSILNIYDDTLADLAGSGNELFDLRDSAREAFAASAEAVKQFEEANSLSGKSSAQIRQEIESIQTTIDSLLSGENISFQEFRELSQLTAVQSALERELSSIIGVESEYENLISAREQAAKDLAFAEATILELGDSLIDTRRTESEIIQQVQDATVSFIEAQKDLEDITKLLAENNFDLNQAREDENDRVLQVSSALKKLERDMKSLESVISSILGDPQLLEQIRQSAISVGELIARNLGFEEGSVEWDAVVSENLNAAVNAFEQGIVPIANTLNRILGFDIQNLTGVNYELDTLSVTSQSLTSKFKQFNSDLVKYLDSEGLAEFYGSGGVFAKFRDSLVNTIAVNGFDVLTAAGGPLEGFELSADSLESALISLATTSSGTVVTLESIEDTISSISSSIGTDATGLTGSIDTLYSSISTGTETLTGSIDGLFNTLSSDIQEFNSSISGVELIDFSAIGIELRSAFDELISVFAIDNTDNVSALKTSLIDLNSVIDGLAKTGIDPITTIPESIDTLVNNILNLENAIDGFTDGGGIQAFISSVEQLAQAIANAFARINLEGDVPIIEGIDYTNAITQAYQDILGRTPDPEGLSFYQNALQDPNFGVNELIAQLESSAEKLYITPAFLDLLGRTPSVDEIYEYKNIVTSLDQMVQILTDLYNLDEPAPTPTPTPTPTPAPLTDAQIIDKIFSEYNRLLGRDPDTAGFSFYSDIIRENNDFDLESAIKGSWEYRKIKPAYEKVLGRTPDLEGIQYYESILEQNPLFDLEAALKSSIEATKIIPAYLQVLGRMPDLAGIQFYNSVFEQNPNFDLVAELQKSIGMASGGYVYGPGTSTSDSIPARLSRGEYVIQASAVEKLGINALNALNATGDMMSIYRANSDFSLNRAPINLGQNNQKSDSIANGNSDTNIEVNVINNGTAQQPTSEPVVRRENGKIVVDVILEDIRNNGPIKRTIRSIR